MSGYWWGSASERVLTPLVVGKGSVVTPSASALSIARDWCLLRALVSELIVMKHCTGDGEEGALNVEAVTAILIMLQSASHLQAAKTSITRGQYHVRKRETRLEA
jgi:hypothetical protein